MNRNYEYDAALVKVVDGDTVDMLVDLGFDVKMKVRFRLYGINAPEMNTEGGKAAKLFLGSIIGQAGNFLISTLKDKREKYGRYLCVIHYDENTTVNQMMIDGGHAVAYMV